MKDWYDGFSFGEKKDIYNPWSVINFLNKKKADAYWANTSSNSLAGTLIREGSPDVKKTFERLMRGESFCVELDEQIVYDQLNDDEQAIWSLLLASGYLKVKSFNAYMTDFGQWKKEYELELTNFEVKVMFQKMIRKWESADRRRAQNTQNRKEQPMTHPEDIIQMLDSMTSSGVSRIKVETADSLEEGCAQKSYHHGRCDVGSPFATGKLFDLEEQENDD